MRSNEQLCDALVVPVEGIEPPLLAEHDFESCASTSSATRARCYLYIIRQNIQRAGAGKQNRRRDRHRGLISVHQRWRQAGRPPLIASGVLN